MKNDETVTDIIGITEALLHRQAKNNETVTDIDGNVYHTIKIGTQVWMVENLKTTKYNNGDLIGTTTPVTLDISAQNTPKYQWAYCGKESNLVTYGRLYTWHAITDIRGICPTGWHVPNDEELEILISNPNLIRISKNEVRNTRESDEIGIKLLPGGTRHYDGTFNGIGVSGHYWSSTESAIGSAERERDLSYANSIRCVKDFDNNKYPSVTNRDSETFRVIKDMDIVEIKVGDQFPKWDGQRANIKSLETKEKSLVFSEVTTFYAQQQQKDIENLLLQTLNIDNTIDWDTLKDKKKFITPNFKNEYQSEMYKVVRPNSPFLNDLPIEPSKSIFHPALSIIDKIFKSLAQKKLIQAENQYQLALSEWKNDLTQVEEQNKKINEDYQIVLNKVEAHKDVIRKKYEKLELESKQQESDFYKAQDEFNVKMETLKSLYFDHNSESIIEYCKLVLNNSQYPDFMSKDFELDYNNNSKMLLVEYVLPAPEQFPTLTEVKYIATKNELKGSYLSESQFAKNYENAIYNITLRTLHELFKADQANAIDIIVFNGWVKTFNKATGRTVNSCIVSIQSKKSEFVEINLSKVEPKACFKNLKGIGSSKLSGITAVQPIVQICKTDKRFVSSYEVANQLNEGSNLASMDWEDFEHLIREIFEKEFSSTGGEVKVTQASRDGGVDAIAFDPDPIRGGKIVIQAKRYTNTVGVSAVRDLYGTVLNEGATKGILVTTADYGSDAYEFAKNKPITLMNGANLLYLLEKHGHEARIDIAEAKKMQNMQ